MITADELKEELRYDPDTGYFYWLRSKGGMRAGDRAGLLQPKGNRTIGVRNGVYQEHRLAWLYVHGSWPKNQIDHINCNSSDNRIANLREATPFQNQGNTRLPKTNTSGFKGVWFRKQTGKWEARIKCRGKPRHLGTFPTPELASEAYWRAAQEQFGEFARLK
jgi:hypothetical protein